MKPSIPKGTRDFLPEQVLRRQYIFTTIERVFQKYGYQPIETPIMENLDTLTGKYGEEGDRLLFKVLNNGDFLDKADARALEARDSQGLVPSIAKRGLRYDLTVPFARYVVMYQNELSFPFKRYAIQPVWRGDRPQKGRYQEFYQCDADVVGSDALVYEAELIQLFDEVYHALGIQVQIRINNRKVLAGIAEKAGISDRLVDMTVAIDKLDKIGIEGVRNELAKREIGAEAIEIISSILQLSELTELKEELTHSEIGRSGIAEMERVLAYLQEQPLANQLTFDITLARGLNYYTGCILEVVADPTAYPDLVMGSIGGGGRYDDLTGVFGLKGTSGVGISFGADRIYDVLDEINGFPSNSPAALKVLLIAFDEQSHAKAFDYLCELRRAGIHADLYPEPAKLKKQMKYANQRAVPYTILIGEEEVKSGKLSLKAMETGEQESLPLATIIERLK